MQSANALAVHAGVVVDERDRRIRGIAVEGVHDTRAGGTGAVDNYALVARGAPHQQILGDITAANEVQPAERPEDDGNPERLGCHSQGPGRAGQYDGRTQRDLG